ncbi:MAG: type II secretion system F family protein [Nocardioidaceae bacterium]|nr:type II secretion system F family protein [Nocardioidaceae bacterium]
MTSQQGSTAALLAAAAAFAGVWSFVPPASVLRRRLAIPTDGDRHLSALRVTLGVASAVGATWLLVGSAPRLLVLAVVGSGVAVACDRLVRSWRNGRRRRGRAVAVIGLCDALSAELRAGLPAVQVVERSLEPWPEWDVIVTAARLGGDVPQAIRTVAAEPGADGLRAVAAAWEVAEQSGAALAEVLEQVAAGLRSDDDARAEVVAALAPPRATAKMLACLPVFGLGLGASMDAHPVDFLLHTDLGLMCLGAGVLLALVGVWWVERMAAAAEV